MSKKRSAITNEQLKPILVASALEPEQSVAIAKMMDEVIGYADRMLAIKNSLEVLTGFDLRNVCYIGINAKVKKEGEAPKARTSVSAIDILTKKRDAKEITPEQYQKAVVAELLKESTAVKSAPALAPVAAPAEPASDEEDDDTPEA